MRKKEKKHTQTTNNDIKNKQDQRKTKKNNYFLYIFEYNIIYFISFFL